MVSLAQKIIKMGGYQVGSPVYVTTEYMEFSGYTYLYTGYFSYMLWYDYNYINQEIYGLHVDVPKKKSLTMAQSIQVIKATDGP